MADQGLKDPRTMVPADATRTIHRSRSKAVYFALVVCAFALLAPPCAPIIGIAIDMYKSKRERHQLLHETDHQALLAASRNLMRDYAGQDIPNPASDPRVPLIIRELGPSYMVITSQQFRVELHGGFDHYGFVAYPEGVNAGDGWGKLLDGLFYYTE